MSCKTTSGPFALLAANNAASAFLTSILKSVLKKVLRGYAVCPIIFSSTDAGWSSLAARRAHNPKVVGSNPTPATKQRIANVEQHQGLAKPAGLFCLRLLFLPPSSSILLPHSFPFAASLKILQHRMQRDDPGRTQKQAATRQQCLQQRIREHRHGQSAQRDKTEVAKEIRPGGLAEKRPHWNALASPNAAQAYADV
jgi:hypothetical protein